MGRKPLRMCSAERMRSRRNSEVQETENENPTIRWRRLSDGNGGSGRPRDLQQGCTSYTAAELSGLPSPRRGRTHVAAHLYGGTAVGQGDQGRGGYAKNAALVRGPQVRSLLQ